MTMATDQKSDCRNNKGSLKKQSEIEEVDEQETSPGSDQSDATITAEKEIIQTDIKVSSPTQNNAPPDCNHVQNNPKLGKLTRGKAFEITSPPIEQTNLLESPSNGLLTKSVSIPRLEKTNSQSSEAGTSSSLSRDSSFDKSPYKDSTGIDLEEFIHKTLNKTQKDRSMLLKLETDINNFINEPKHHYLKFPQMSSYDRMLVHRISAFFGLDHNVDQTGKCVIVNKTSNTRVPNFSFKDHIEAGEPGNLRRPKTIMKRSVNSLDDRESRHKLSAKNFMNSKAKSFEERKEEYEKVRNKIFKSVDDTGLQVEAFTEEEMAVTQIYKADMIPVRPNSLSKTDGNHLGSSTDSSGYGTDDRSSSKARGIPKANSFGGTTHVNQKSGPYKSYSMNKADSFNCGMSLGSPLQRPGIPTPPGSRTDSSPLSRCSSSGPVQSPLQGVFPTPSGQQVYIVATDLNNVPPGSVIIDPRTGQPISNSDGTLYHHTPGHQPPPQPGMIIQQQVPEMWSNVQHQPHECSGVPEMCHHLSSLSLNSSLGLTPQSSLSLSHQSSLSQQNSVDSSTGEPPGPPQIMMASQPQMHTVFSQQGPMPQGQYLPCPQGMQTSNVRYVYPVQTSGPMENQNFSQNAPYPSPMATGFTNFQNNPCQTVETMNQNSYPVQGSGSETYQTYPVQYPNQSASYGQMQSTMYYSSVPTSSSPQMGLVYNGNQGQFHHQSQIQPSQNSNPAIAMQGSASSVVNMGQPVAVQAPNNFIYPNVAQQPQRTPNPQIIQIPNVQMHNAAPMVRSMQMNVQVPSQMGGIQHTGMVAGQPSQVTVGKSLSLDSMMPKYENDNKECVMSSPVVAGPPNRQFLPGLRPATQITDVRFVGQPTFRPPVQQVQIHPQSYIQSQPQKQKNVSTSYSNKQQKLKKSRSKDSDSSHQSVESIEAQTGNVLEVFDLPAGMIRSEAEKLLKDLASSGAQIQFIAQDNVQYQNDIGNTPIGAFHKIVAIFSSSAGANQILQTHTNSSYKLRPSSLESIGVRT